PNTGDRPAGRGLRRLAALGAALAVLVTGACGNPTANSSAGGAASTTAAPAGTETVVGEDVFLENALAFNGAVDWTASKTVRIELGEKLPEMFFKAEDVTLQAGIPYVLELVNTGKITHEFTADKFFRSSSVRKIASENSEVRVPFFTEIEVLAGKTVQVFAIPVLPGRFEMLCRLPGHREAGMEGTITVTGTAKGLPAPVLGSMNAGPWLQNGQELVDAAAATWDTKAKRVRIEAGEGGATGMFFKPKELVLKKDMPYVIELVNVGTILHEYTADDFFPTVAFRKAQDAAGEYKSPLLREAEVLAGKQLDLYLIPTKAGTFKIVCLLEGHETAGMVGTIKVTP
ncbi:MAG: hypothetical protein M3537_05830, partial [Chloroflexota bacterium]|nr:hypothetical protein [Chloroflexota bacterium]